MYILDYDIHGIPITKDSIVRGINNRKYGPPGHMTGNSLVRDWHNLQRLMHIAYEERTIEVVGDLNKNPELLKMENWYKEL
jgi:hypothetical protein